MSFAGQFLITISTSSRLNLGRDFILKIKNTYLLGVFYEQLKG